MQDIKILNIPNYYCSYYLLGLNRIAFLHYTPSREFEHLDNRPFLVIEVKGKVIVIENDDPIGVDKKAYDFSDLYFATNRLKNREDYNQPKTRSLFPHYPIDILGLYSRVFGLQGLRKVGLKNFAREVYILNKRPDFSNIPFLLPEGNYVFFSGNIWEKEPWANQVRADYVMACKSHPLIKFEGGMVPRSDGKLCGLNPEVINRGYPPKEFADKSSKSVLVFNNPAVLDAVSWRLAEYLNYGCFIISFPFKIQLPIEPVHGHEIHFLNDTSELNELITYAMTHFDYRKRLSQGAKQYFEKYCLPEKQAKMILETT